MGARLKWVYEVPPVSDVADIKIYAQHAVEVLQPTAQPLRPPHPTPETQPETLLDSNVQLGFRLLADIHPEFYYLASISRTICRNV